MFFWSRLRRKIPAGCILASAYALPPKIVNHSFVSGFDFAKIPKRAIEKTEVILFEPLLHGGLFFSRDRKALEVLSPDGKEILQVPISQGMISGKGWKSRSLESQGEENFFGRRRQGGDLFSAHDDRLSYKPEKAMPGALWEVPLSFEVLGLGYHPQSGFLAGWGAFPGRLFVFPPSRLTLSRIEWIENSEPVAFLPCDRNHSWLAENLHDGTSRFVYFEDAVPKAFASVDFSSNKKLSDMTAMIAASCDELFVAGSFGLVRVRFAKGKQ